MFELAVEAGSGHRWLVKSGKWIAAFVPDLTDDEVKDIIDRLNNSEACVP